MHLSGGCWGLFSQSSLCPPMPPTLCVSSRQSHEGADQLPEQQGGRNALHGSFGPLGAASQQPEGTKGTACAPQHTNHSTFNNYFFWPSGLSLLLDSTAVSDSLAFPLKGQDDSEVSQRSITDRGGAQPLQEGSVCIHPSIHSFIVGISGGR